MPWNINQVDFLLLNCIFIFFYYFANENVARYYNILSTSGKYIGRTINKSIKSKHVTIFTLPCLI